MVPIVHIELTGKAILTILAIVAVIAVTLGLVWLIVGPMAAVAGGLVIVVIIRGLMALFR